MRVWLGRLGAICVLVAALSASGVLSVPPVYAANLPLPEPKPNGHGRVTSQLMTKALPARSLFKAAKTAATLPPAALGKYNRGCLAGAEQLAPNGPGWQAMRLSRNRHWAHPNMIQLIKRLAADATKLDGWPGLLVGDLSMARGGPMWPSHSSHQIGLDADIWLTPMPDRKLTYKEREATSATCMLQSCGNSKRQLEINTETFGDGQIRLLKRAASYPEVERVLIHPTIKRHICSVEKAAGRNTSWLAKLRPVWGHNYHFHIRMKCPPGNPNCRPQNPPPTVDGCDKEAEYWRKRIIARFTPLDCSKPENQSRGACFCRRNKGHARCQPRKRRLLTLADLPRACQGVLQK
jgi:penicillin-insensitive murein endopeptidase